VCLSAASPAYCLTCRSGFPRAFWQTRSRDRSPKDQAERYRGNGGRCTRKRKSNPDRTEAARIDRFNHRATILSTTSESFCARPKISREVTDRCLARLIGLSLAHAYCRGRRPFALHSRRQRSDFGWSFSYLSTRCFHPNRRRSVVRARYQGFHPAIC